MAWIVYRSYRTRQRFGDVDHSGDTPEPRTRTIDVTEAGPDGRPGRRFAVLADAEEYARRSRAATGWAPAGAFDLDVTDPYEIADGAAA